MFGLIQFALGVVITIQAHVGYAPWEVFHVGMSLSTGITVGSASIVAGVVIVVIVTIAGEKIGIGTLASIIVTGIAIDIIILLDIIPVAPNMAVGIVMLLVGLFINATGSYFYIKSSFGTGPRDSLMVVMKRKTRLPIGVCRSLLEITVTVVGWFLGGMVGIGTIVSAVAIGIFIQLVFKMFKFDVAAVEHEMIIQTLKNIRAGFRNAKSSNDK